MKTQKLYGETFEIIHPKIPVSYAYPSQWDYLSIETAYDRPSQAKREIWAYWQEFGKAASDSVEPYVFGIPFISSRNCFAFSVTMNVFDAETQEFVGVAYITRDHNRLYLNN